MSRWIQTYTGKEFDFFEPRRELIDIADIAHSLPMLARWNAHAKWFYSVGAHSVQVSMRIEAAGGSEHEQLAGLLHDASEAYLSDLPSPIKKQFPDVKAAEENVQEAIFKRFGLPWPMPQIVHDADLACLIVEAQHLFLRTPSWVGQRYKMPDSMLETNDKLHALSKCVTFPNKKSLTQTDEVRELFMRRFIELGGAVNG